MSHKRVSGWRVRSEMPEEFIRLCCTEPKDGSSGFEWIARSHDRTLVCRFSFSGKNYYYKEYFFPGFYKLLKDLFRGFWNERAARIHEKLTQAGFPVAPVSAVGAKGWRRFMVTAEAAGEPIRTFRRNLSGSSRIELIRRYGEMIGRLHGCGFSHGDLRWGNILVQPVDGRFEFLLIDNERTQFHRRGIPLRLCIKNLVHTRYSGLSEGMDEEEWQVFFNAYCNRFPQAERIRNRLDQGMRRKLKQRIRRGEKKSQRIRK
jgi:tRNA A-37 threonylcarbamoyl transferase component Bud32